MFKFLALTSLLFLGSLTCMASEEAPKQVLERTTSGRFFEHTPAASTQITSVDYYLGSEGIGELGAHKLASDGASRCFVNGESVTRLEFVVANTANEFKSAQMACLITAHALGIAPKVDKDPKVREIAQRLSDFKKAELQAIAASKAKAERPGLLSRLFGRR